MACSYRQTQNFLLKESGEETPCNTKNVQKPQMVQEKSAGVNLEWLNLLFIKSPGKPEESRSLELTCCSECDT